jgi:hypothetical protein
MRVGTDATEDNHLLLTALEAIYRSDLDLGHGMLGIKGSGDVTAALLVLVGLVSMLLDHILSLSQILVNLSDLGDVRSHHADL